MAPDPVPALPVTPSALPEPGPSVPQRVLAVPGEGLEPRGGGGRKRVVVIGAGLAGLVAAFELERRGHDPVVLEAQNRVGGRIHTLRDLAPGLYAEAGGMRIPRVHELTLAYCRLFGLTLRPFVMDNPRTYVHLAGRRMRHAEADRDPGSLPFALAEHERGRTYLELWNEATREIRELYDREGEGALARIGEQYGSTSLRGFLQERGFSEGAIELYGIMSFREANMGASVVEQLREIVGRAFEDMQEIAGGMDQLPRAFYGRLAGRVRFGAHVHAIEQDEGGVTVRFRTRAGEFSETGHHAICTLPFGLLRHLDFSPPLTLGKYRAIRGLNYNPSTKILLQFRRRFWEQDDGIVGGTTATDLPIRRIVYPSHSEPGEERGVLLASYTWGQDAARWGALAPDDRVALALKDVAKIHPQAPRDFEAGASYAWYNDPYAGGAFALFEPGQESALQADIVKPEGRVQFAGEHCSLWHAWIQGALEAGIRAATAIHLAPQEEGQAAERRASG